jgi:cytochrome c oxidase assembly protein subunit 15
MRGLLIAGVLLCFGVIALGAFVRLTNAGISCPDWPECYGELTPAGAAASGRAQAEFPGRPLHEGRAWHEMIHRYVAGTLGIVILLITALALAAPAEQRLVGRGAALVLFATVLVQAALGMLTVTWLLKPLIVTLHLLFGMATLALLWWLWLDLAASPHRARAPRGPRLSSMLAGSTEPGGAGASAAAARMALGLAILGLCVLAVQFFLGAWTSANYAAYACPDFPTCQGAWWPHADFRDAFVLWRPLHDVDYQGGILPNAARVAIHLTHRLGAIAVTLTLGLTGLYILRHRSLAEARPHAWLVLGALGLQLAIGISMVLATFPLWLTTAHTAGAALLLMALLGLVSKLRTLRAVRAVGVA